VRCATGAAVLAFAASLAGCVDPETREVAGRDLYLRHCASCHGQAGRGDGPLAASLKRPPADLTRIGARAGRFDEAAVMSTIDGRHAVAEHGPREMPVWGVVFEQQQEGQPFQVYAGLRQTRALTDYLRSIQVKR
jgi:mono/diheme cytochrome c family protein